MKRLYIITVVMALFSVSCNDWLDVRPDTEQKDKDLFTTYKGFQDALTGCYMSLAGQDIYGERLTMSNIESLANLWYQFRNSTRYEDNDLMEHNYTSDYSKAAIKTIYAGLFNVIAQANMIIKYAEKNGDVIEDPAARAVITGEAYAIRAFCQLDVLRLFGQMPQGASQQVELPYSETTSIDEMPAYYGFDAYVAKLESDLVKAESFLKDSDPVFQYTFSNLNSVSGNELNDSYMYYRQARMNYWAVKAIQARMYLYLGKKEKAYALAKGIIDAKGVDGKPVMTMSGETDIAKGYKTCPSECLLYLSKYNVKTYSTEFLLGNQTDVQVGSGHLVVSHSMLTDLYAGQNTGSHNRYLNCWNRNVKDASASLYAAITKYYFADDAENQMLYYQIIPMLRMSEVYLIAMETSSDLDEINGWYTDYMLAHNVVLNEAGFSSLNDVPKEIVNEYRREFYGEGQMFYTYKRTGTASMLWGNGTADEKVYILPLPETEYNPNSQIK
ncbi:RagB/SusD family nutrient uptake outer membrane protein [Butyricimonas hominis]|uniref:RagB/SusD family nutrient uptake outer membrane protein n=1 Tax=Butyricimonas hominis TaxID=2763032 RepID=A0ABR7CWG2_9BACT|nr:MULTISPECIES: RagB/SusD family nutrient uptake outer membrane protein [Butyricimonas]MBC5620015.1 RagB/SusD family nutrient uptake outer membrane protein [Butyricimonas hominis]